MITLNKEYKILSDRLRGKKPKFKVKKMAKHTSINTELSTMKSGQN